MQTKEPVDPFGSVARAYTYDISRQIVYNIIPHTLYNRNGWSRELMLAEDKSSCLPPDVMSPSIALRRIIACFFSFWYNKKVIAQSVGRHED